MLFSISAVFMLVAISLTSAVGSNETKTVVEKKESPLFGIRTRLAIGERLENLKEIIKTRFIGDRVFFLPLQWLKNREDLSVRENLGSKTNKMHPIASCVNTCYTYCKTRWAPCDIKAKFVGE